MGVERVERVDLGDRGQMAAPEPSDLTLDAAILVRALSPGMQ
jgi:hypothetical protein